MTSKTYQTAGLFFTVLCGILAIAVLNTPTPPTTPALPKPIPARSLSYWTPVITKIAVPRPVGSPGHEKVQKYLLNQMRGLCLKTTTQPFQHAGTTCNNIVGQWPGRSKKTIIVGAHWDGAYGYPAADDNASGTLLVLMVADKLRLEENLNHTIKFILFDAEEDGLIGSQHYASAMKDDCDFMVNADMVGHVKVQALTPDDSIDRVFRRFPWARPYAVHGPDALSKRSDQSSFAAKGIPSMWVFTGTHERYHQPTDTVDTLNLKGIEMLRDFVVAVILDYDQSGKVPKLDPMKDHPCVTSPNWISYPEQQQTPDYGPVVTDVERHLYPGHPYREPDRVTWVHEGTHGINSLVRNANGKPGFYILKNHAYLLDEPQTTVAAAAQAVPASLRGQIYSLYCLQSQGSWNNQPSYLFDEWDAYTNGTIARKVLKIADRRESASYMLEMAVYSTCVPYCCKVRNEDTKYFLRWLWERSLMLVEDDSVIQTLRTSPDADDLRTFMRGYFGVGWTKSKLGF